MSSAHWLSVLSEILASFCDHKSQRAQGHSVYQALQELPGGKEANYLAALDSWISTTMKQVEKANNNSSDLQLHLQNTRTQILFRDRLPILLSLFRSIARDFAESSVQQRTLPGGSTKLHLNNVHDSTANQRGTAGLERMISTEWICQTAGDVLCLCVLASTTRIQNAPKSTPTKAARAVFQEARRQWIDEFESHELFETMGRIVLLHCSSCPMLTQSVILYFLSNIRRAHDAQCTSCAGPCTFPTLCRDLVVQIATPSSCQTRGNLGRATQLTRHKFKSSQIALNKLLFLAVQHYSGLVCASNSETARSETTARSPRFDFYDAFDTACLVSCLVFLGGNPYEICAVTQAQGNGANVGSAIQISKRVEDDHLMFTVLQSMFIGSETMRRLQQKGLAVRITCVPSRSIYRGPTDSSNGDVQYDTDSETEDKSGPNQNEPVLKQSIEQILDSEFKFLKADIRSLQREHNQLKNETGHTLVLLSKLLTMKYQPLPQLVHDTSKHGLVPRLHLEEECNTSSAGTMSSKGSWIESQSGRSVSSRKPNTLQQYETGDEALPDVHNSQVTQEQQRNLSVTSRSDSSNSSGSETSNEEGGRSNRITHDTSQYLDDGHEHNDQGESSETSADELEPQSHDVDDAATRSQLGESNDRSQIEDSVGQGEDEVAPEHGYSDDMAGQSQAEDKVAQNEADNTVAQQQSEEASTQNEAEDTGTQIVAEDTVAQQQSEDAGTQIVAEDTVAQQQSEDAGTQIEAEDTVAQQQSEVTGTENEAGTQKQAEDIVTQKQAEDADTQEQAEDTGTQNEAGTQKQAEDTGTQKQAEDTGTQKQAEDADTQKQAEDTVSQNHKSVNILTPNREDTHRDENSSADQNRQQLEL